MQNLGDSAPVRLPVDMDLHVKESAPHCVSRKVNVLPLSGNLFNPNDIAKFEIPVGVAGQYLDTSQSYLYFRVKNVDPANVPLFVDHNAASFIQKIEVYSSSMLIETINAYNVLYSTMLDTQTGALDRQTYQSQILGTDQDVNNVVNTSRGGIQIVATQTVAFALPLFSGVIGTGNSKNLPIGDLTDLRLEITWETNANACLTPTSTSISTNIWQIVQAELALQVLQMDHDVDRMIHDSHRGNPIMISAETYRNYNTVLNASQGSDSTIIPLKFTSVKSLFGQYRLANNLNTFTNASISSRRNPFASSGGSVPQAQLLCGNLYLPQIPMRTPSEIFTEYSKAWHTLGNVNNKTVINRQTYDQANEPGTAYMTNLANPNINGNTIVATTITTNIIQTNYPHGLVVGQAIYYTGATTSTNLTTNTMFWVVAVQSPYIFQLSTTPGGAAISIVASATGSLSYLVQFIVSFNATGNVITTSIPHGLGVGSQIYYTGANAGGLTQNTIYYVLSVPAPNQFTVSTTFGGTVSTLTTAQLATTPVVGYSFTSYLPPQPIYNTSPSFAWGINTDAFYQQSALSMSGTNTQSGNVFWNATYSATTPSGGHRLDIFAHYDMILIIDPVSKQMTVKY